MKNSKKVSLAMLLMAFIFSVSIISCKKKTEDPQPTTKTLNKDLLVGKKWYSQNNLYVHDFKTGGVYSVKGTWEWKNNSDTMVIDLDGAGSANQPELWKFFWSAEKEMYAKPAKSGADGFLFKDQPW
jgi:hypothetical protein